MNKTLLLIGTLALAGLANATSYTKMIISAPMTAAGHSMSAGEYALEVKGSTATFTNMNTGKSFKTSVKVENAGEKFENTAVESQAKDGARQINWIEVGGSSTKLELGE